MVIESEGVLLFVSTGIGRGRLGQRSTIALFIQILLFVLFANMFLRTSGNISSAVVVAAFLLWGLVATITPMTLRVTVTDTQVRCQELPRGTRAMRRDQIAAVKRTYVPMGRGMSAAYITIVPRDLTLRPLDVRTDFMRQADVLALWRILRA